MVVKKLDGRVQDLNLLSIRLNNRASIKSSKFEFIFLYNGNFGDF